MNCWIPNATGRCAIWNTFQWKLKKASYATLLRVPGIGPKSASRITYARRYGRLNFDNLKRMGVVLKRAHYFITCGGRQMYRTPIEEAYITRQLVQVDAKRFPESTTFQ